MSHVGPDLSFLHHGRRWGIDEVSADRQANTDVGGRLQVGHSWAEVGTVIVATAKEFTQKGSVWGARHCLRPLAAGSRIGARHRPSLLPLTYLALWG